MNTHAHLAAALAVCFLAGLPALASQSANQPQASPDSPTSTARPGPDRIAERLRDRLDQLDRFRARLDQAIRDIEAGTPPAEALAPIADQLEERFGERSSPRRGPGSGERPWDAPHDDDRWSDGPGMPPDALPTEPVTIEQTRAFIARHLPRLAERIDAAAQREPALADRMVERLIPRIADIVRAEDDDPTFVRLRVDEMQVGYEIVVRARELRELSRPGEPDPADNTARIAEAEAQIRALLARQFDLRQQLEAHRIERARAEAEAAAARLAEQAAHRDATIDEHMARLKQRVLDRRDDRGRGEGRERQKRD